MFSKGWTKIIILLFLVMLVPLLLDSFGIDIIEGAGPTSGGGGQKTAVGKGAVGKGAFEAKAAEDAMKAKAALDATLAEKAKAKAKAAAPTGATPADTNEEAEENSELAELFTVNNNNGLDYAYAYALEPFFEGAATKAKAAPVAAPAPAPKKKPVCKIIARLDKNKNNSAKLTKYIGTLTKWSEKNCK